MSSSHRRGSTTISHKIPVYTGMTKFHSIIIYHWSLQQWYKWYKKALSLYLSYHPIDIIIAKSFSLEFCKLLFRWGNTVSLKHYSQSFSIINTTYKMIDHRLDFTIFCYEIHTNQRNTLSFDDRSLNHGLNSHISLQVFSRTRSENFRRYSSYHTPLKSSSHKPSLYLFYPKTKSQTRIYVRANDIRFINIFSHEIKHLTHHGRIITSLSELTFKTR